MCKHAWLLYVYYAQRWVSNKGLFTKWTEAGGECLASLALLDPASKERGNSFMLMTSSLSVGREEVVVIILWWSSPVICSSVVDEIGCQKAPEMTVLASSISILDSRWANLRCPLASPTGEDVGDLTTTAHGEASSILRDVEGQQQRPPLLFPKQSRIGAVNIDLNSLRKLSLNQP